MSSSQRLGLPYTSLSAWWREARAWIAAIVGVPATGYLIYDRWKQSLWYAEDAFKDGLKKPVLDRVDLDEASVLTSLPGEGEVDQQGDGRLPVPKEMKGWMRPSSGSILAVHGPSGCGKTTAACIEACKLWDQRNGKGAPIIIIRLKGADSDDGVKGCIRSAFGADDVPLNNVFPAMEKTLKWLCDSEREEWRGFRPLVVVDDFHRGHEDARNAMKSLMELVKMGGRRSKGVAFLLMSSKGNLSEMARGYSGFNKAFIHTVYYPFSFTRERLVRWAKTFAAGSTAKEAAVEKASGEAAVEKAGEGAVEHAVDHLAPSLVMIKRAVVEGSLDQELEDEKDLVKRFFSNLEARMDMDKGNSNRVLPKTVVAAFETLDALTKGDLWSQSKKGEERQLRDPASTIELAKDSEVQFEGFGAWDTAWTLLMDDNLVSWMRMNDTVSLYCNLVKFAYEELKETERLVELLKRAKLEAGLGA